MFPEGGMRGVKKTHPFPEVVLGVGFPRPQTDESATLGGYYPLSFNQLVGMKGKQSTVHNEMYKAAIPRRYSSKKIYAAARAVAAARSSHNVSALRPSCAPQRCKSLKSTALESSGKRPMHVR